MYVCTLNSVHSLIHCVRLNLKGLTFESSSWLETPSSKLHTGDEMWVRRQSELQITIQYRLLRMHTNVHTLIGHSRQCVTSPVLLLEGDVQWMSEEHTTG